MAANLFIDRSGKGPQLTLLHGWGLHGGVFDNLKNGLEEEFSLNVVDLPGYGYSAGSIASGLEQMCERVVEGLSAHGVKQTWLLGWSLGGLVAIRMAEKYPQLVEGLLLVASNPCFVQRADWATGIAVDVLQQFSVELQKNYAETIKRFLALEARGDEHARDIIRMTREAVFVRGEPDPQALADGLEILRSSDLRLALRDLKLPIYFIGGERDVLVPSAALYKTAETIPTARVAIIPGAGHVPFLSNPEGFQQQVKVFIHGG